MRSSMFGPLLNGKYVIALSPPWSLSAELTRQPELLSNKSDLGPTLRDRRSKATTDGSANSTLLPKHGVISEGS